MARFDRDVVLAAALGLADEGGLGAVTFRRIAERLSVTPMTLYRYVKSKEDILDGLAEKLYAELELGDPASDWWEVLADLARSTRSVLIARPWAAPLFARPLAGPHGHALNEALLTTLDRAGFSTAEASELHDQLSNIVFALIEAELGGKPSRAAFERGLELLHAGLEARRQAQ